MNNYSQNWLLELINLYHLSIISATEPKAQVYYCDHLLSVVCPSVRHQLSLCQWFTFLTSSPIPLDRFWSNLVGMKCSWSLSNVIVLSLAISTQRWHPEVDLRLAKLECREVQETHCTCTFTDGTQVHDLWHFWASRLCSYFIMILKRYG